MEAYATESRAWTPQQAQLVDWLAGQCSRAWENIRLREDRKQAEEMLAESEKRRKVAEAVQVERERFNNVLDMLPAYVVLLSPDYHVPFANRFFEKRFGKSEGRRCYEYLFQRTEPCENCETYKVLKTGEPHRSEWTGPDNRNYDIYDFPFTDVDGSPLIMEVGVDITERKQAEAALRLSSAYNRSLIEASLDPLVTIGPDGEDHRCQCRNRVCDRLLADGTCRDGFQRLLHRAREGPCRVRAGVPRRFRAGLCPRTTASRQTRDFGTLQAPRSTVMKEEG